ncbi:SDR family NAD(P)-dependent oxidoreductase [Mycolicibacterium baixiangningiae]|uniref:SDR family NAD(P)-dependent oxidoreductase n=1 Tax=Mycolicibacterium baixiangningiae TaxID=2761578 RepID=UPI0018661764|nr:SDR family NAD(P)-dependent oxidoreductase [Mycolicibacterium baixiangningiae]
MAHSPTLEGKKLLITGAASGMGRALADIAVAQGADVALFDINADGLDKAKQELEGADSKVVTIPADLTQWAQVESGVNHALEELGGIDALCNVAGWDEPGRFWEQSLEFWEKIININLWSNLYMTRAVVPKLIEQNSGTIVNVASDAGRVGSKGETVYAASKGGVIALTKSLARELAPYTVTVNAVCPGPTMTPLLQSEIDLTPKLIEKLVRAIPLRRVAEPADPAAVVAFFASDAASYMTGQVVSVSGGLTMAG